MQSLLTDNGEKLVNNIEKDSGVFVHIIHSQGVDETVVLKGTSESVAKAEQMGHSCKIGI